MTGRCTADHRRKAEGRGDTAYFNIREPATPRCDEHAEMNLDVPNELLEDGLDMVITPRAAKDSSACCGATDKDTVLLIEPTTRELRCAVSCVEAFERG